MLLRKPVVLPIFSPNSDLRVLTLSTVPGIRFVYFLRQPSCMGTKSLNILSTSPVKYTTGFIQASMGKIQGLFMNF